MEIASSGQTAQAQQTGSAAPAQAALIGSDFQTFLTMLTTQMKNQDPLNPIESSDFAVQLATFSGVEQQVRGNQLLESLGAQLGVLGMAQLSGWVGMEARAIAPVAFDGAPITLSPEVGAFADKAVLVARNARGEEVQRQDLALPATTVQWDGLDAGGRPLPSGQYSFAVESYSNDALLSVTPVQTYTEVIEARVENGQTLLVLAGGGEVLASEITGLRAADGPSGL